MRKIRQHSGIWQYLNAAGVLEGGSEEAIKKAKRAYRKNYLSEYKKRQRKLKKEFIVMLSVADGEYSNITTAAKKHSMPVTTFLKTATLAYMNQTFIVPNKVQLSVIEQLLSQCLNEVQLITRTKEKYSWEREQKYDAIEKRIIKLETQISEVLRNPPLVTAHDSQNKIT
jgi:hypothetical protein